MNRKGIIEFCNEMIFPQCESGMLDIPGMQDAVRLVTSWRKEHGWPKKEDMHPAVKNGFLYMNGDSLGRIAMAPGGGCFSEEGYFWEGKCLAAGETDS